MAHNPFWQYSLSVYRIPAVAELCLQYQDEHGADVNMLLCAAWLSSIGQPLTEDLLASLLAESYEWQQRCVQPLREARRFLKGQNLAAGGNSEVYHQAKALELEVEALQQHHLYQYLWQLPLAASNHQLLSTNLRRYLAQIIDDENCVQRCAEGLCAALK